MSNGKAATGTSGRRYCLITPCRDEAAYIRRTLETTTSQTVPPSLWIIVDDGSTDETPQILEEFARRHDYIRIIRREDRGKRAVGPGVIEAFYAGLEQIDIDAFDYICKFDGDLEMPPRYFERAMERMEADPYLGNFSGKLFERLPNGQLFEERTGDENAVGPAKFYRVACFKDIGGFVREVAPGVPEPARAVRVRRASAPAVCGLHAADPRRSRTRRTAQRAVAGNDSGARAHTRGGSCGPGPRPGGAPDRAGDRRPPWRVAGAG
jgi:hypothetical protein